ncbi:hypothetical protein [Providencia sp. PROV011]|uniref:hypothetical protein n=2 Tax=Morganellaceae TaxID=1903414 RepID=UPI00065E1192|nr:hypothetical protein [Providencia rettgeri]HCH7934191.1 hypothetical protein [Providencia rettgeri]
MIIDTMEQQLYFMRFNMESNKNVEITYIKPTSSQLIRSVATSTAIETGQESRRLEEEMKAKRERFGHLKLAI